MLFSQFINVFHNKLYLSKRSIHSKAHRYNTILNFPVPMQADSTSTESSPSFSFSLFLKFFYLLPSFLILFFFSLFLFTFTMANLVESYPRPMDQEWYPDSSTFCITGSYLVINLAKIQTNWGWLGLPIKFRHQPNLQSIQTPKANPIKYNMLVPGTFLHLLRLLQAETTKQV